MTLVVLDRFFVVEVDGLGAWEEESVLEVVDVRKTYKKPPIEALAVLALLITLVGMYGLGFAVAGLAILVKRTGQLVFLLQILLLFLTGTFLPLDVMPAPVAFLGKTIPLTWGIDVSRASVAGTGGIATRWMWLLLTSTASLAFGLLVFSWFCRKAREDGALGRY